MYLPLFHTWKGSYPASESSMPGPRWMSDTSAADLNFGSMELTKYPGNREMRLERWRCWSSGKSKSSFHSCSWPHLPTYKPLSVLLIVVSNSVRKVALESFANWKALRVFWNVSQMTFWNSVHPNVTYIRSNCLGIKNINIEFQTETTYISMLATTTRCRNQQSVVCMLIQSEVVDPKQAIVTFVNTYVWWLFTI